MEIRARALDSGRQVAQASAVAGRTLELRIPDQKLWSPDSPHLYDLELELVRGNQALDMVESYFGMRKMSLRRDRRGHRMLALNNDILFQMGPLDQGWWPDGLYTAPTDEALIYDIEVTKELGFNMARKHVKVEPARWYYHCDRLGLLVWQDMPSAYMGRGVERGLFVSPFDEKDAERAGISQAQFEGELREMIDYFQQFPSIVMWVPFNEGWGQYDTARISEWIEHYDPTRLVNAASGWTDRGAGHVYDTHIYPGPGMQYGGFDRAAILGEFGGLGWPVEDHLWWDKRNWGYRTYHSREELNEQYDHIVSQVLGPISRGLAAAIYTQTSDVEGEVNGLMTYDRELVKLDAERLQAIHGKLYAKPPASRVLLPAAHAGTQPWRYTLRTPRRGWEQPGFNDRRWTEGEAPFREKPDPQFANGNRVAGRLDLAAADVQRGSHAEEPLAGGDAHDHGRRGLPKRRESGRARPADAAGVSPREHQRTSRWAQGRRERDRDSRDAGRSAADRPEGHRRGAVRGGVRAGAASRASTALYAPKPG